MDEPVPGRQHNNTVAHQSPGNHHSNASGSSLRHRKSPKDSFHNMAQSEGQSKSNTSLVPHEGRASPHSLERSGRHGSNNISRDKGQGSTLESGYHSNHQASVARETDVGTEMADDYGDYGFGFVSRKASKPDKTQSHSSATTNRHQSQIDAKTLHNVANTPPSLHQQNAASVHDAKRNQPVNYNETVKSKIDGFQSNVGRISDNRPTAGANQRFSPSLPVLGTSSQTTPHYVQSQQPNAAQFERQNISASPGLVLSPEINIPPGPTHKTDVNRAFGSRSEPNSGDARQRMMQSPTDYKHAASKGPALPHGRSPPQPKPRTSLESSTSSQSMRNKSQSAQSRSSLDNQSHDYGSPPSHATRQSPDSANELRQAFNKMAAMSRDTAMTSESHRDSLDSNPATGSSAGAHNVSGVAQSAPSLRHRSATPDSLAMTSWDKSFSPQQSVDEAFKFVTLFIFVSM